MRWRRSIATCGFLLVMAATPVVAQTGPPRVQVGVASWYGARWAGMETTSGQKFDPRKLTAASPNLPLGSIIEVTNLRNGKSVRLLVNDRGPNVRGRILDVSHAAARILGFVGRGLTRVRITVLKTPAQAGTKEASTAR